MGGLKTFPVSMVVAGRRVVVVGDGEPASAKLRLLAKTRAEVHLYSPIGAGIAAQEARGRRYPVHQRLPGHADLQGAALAFIATEDEARDRALADLARSAGVMVNVVDRPEMCDLLTPAFVDRAPVTVAISTEGAAPVLAGLLRARIEALLPPGLGTLARLAGDLRRLVADTLSPGARRLAYWRAYFAREELAEAAARGPAAARRSALELLEEVRGAAETRGTVWFVGAGGATDLLTLRAWRVLAEADLVIHEPGIDAGVLDHVRRDATRIEIAGKGRRQELIGRLAAAARRGQRVVRLVRGDISGGSACQRELAALTGAGVGWAVVPGVAASGGELGEPLPSHLEDVAA